MAKTKPETGLTINQIDAITIEICYAEALVKTLNAEASAEQDPSFLHLLKRQLSLVKEMVCERQIGGRHG